MVRVGIVCGGAVYEDGSLAPHTRSRVEKGIERYDEGHVQKLIVTQFSTARLMARYAIEKGVPETDIFTEEKARSTRENLFFSKSILDRYGWRKGEVISSHWHCPRIKKLIPRILKNYDFDVVPCIDERVASEIEGERKLELVKQVNDSVALNLGWAYWPGWAKNIYGNIEDLLMRIF